MNDRYIVRYRRTRADGVPALIVEDAAGTAWLFVGGALRCPLPAGAGEPPAACDRLMARLGGAARWIGVPEVAPYPLAGLQQLIEGLPAPLQRPDPPLRVLARTRST